MAVDQYSIPAVLAERAQRQPDTQAFTFIDYAVDPAGCPESLTWSEVYGRAQVVAAELLADGTPDDIGGRGRR
jgi:long chain fatty acid CoA FadD26